MFHVKHLSYKYQKYLIKAVC